MSDIRKPWSSDCITAWGNRLILLAYFFYLVTVGAQGENGYRGSIESVRLRRVVI